MDKEEAQHKGHEAGAKKGVGTGMMINIFIFVFGTIVGSFLNVCICRMPKKESIVKPRSHCPSCKKTIGWYDNIPLLSYILLGAKCRHCKVPISFRYFIVELITGSLFFLFFYYFGLTLEFFIYSALSAALVVVSGVDFDIQEIPDEISLPGIPIGLALSFIFPQLMGQGTHLLGLAHSALGVLAGGGLIYLIGLLGEAIFKKEAMGGGDVKLMAMVGAFLGWKLALLAAFILAPLFGAVFGIIVKIKYKESLIPYGPFLSIATIISIVWGEKLISLYISKVIFV
ncbi:MAG: prepilin peptidase [Candidatus Omnitrophota bacterium]